MSSPAGGGGGGVASGTPPAGTGAVVGAVAGAIVTDARLSVPPPAAAIARAINTATTSAPSTYRFSRKLASLPIVGSSTSTRTTTMPVQTMAKRTSNRFSPGMGTLGRPASSTRAIVVSRTTTVARNTVSSTLNQCPTFHRPISGIRNSRPMVMPGITTAP